MPITRCFLPHFPAALTGKPKPPAAQRLRQQLQTLSHLSLPDLQALLGSTFSEDFFLKTPAHDDPPGESVKRRRGIYTPILVFWSFFFQVLNPRMPCLAAVAKIRAWMARKPCKKLPSLNTGAYCLARSGLALSFFTAALDELRQRLLQRATLAWKWHGHHVKVLDGTSYSMPDTEANQGQWPQPKGQKKGCGFPVAKLLGLFCLSTGAWIGHAVDTCYRHDLSLWQRLKHLLVPGDVLLGDAGYCAWALMAELKARGVDSVMRLHQKRPKDMRRGKALGQCDRLQTWLKPKQRGKQCPWSVSEWVALPASLQVRILHITIERKGFRTTQLWLATTLTDPIRYSAESLAELYYRRWSIELFLRDLKTTMQMEVLRCKTPNMVLKELTMHAIVYNTLRLLMLESATTHQVELGRISFKSSLDLVIQWLPECGNQDASRRQITKWRADLSLAISEVLNDIRPERMEPRARKRRPKSSSLLTRPRHQFKEIPHRERYRKVA